MNAAPPVSQAQPVSEAVQPEAPATAASASTRTGSQDFAAALSDAGVKPARKSAANKQQDPASSGSLLPPPGNQPPVALQPPPAPKTDVLAAPIADAADIVKSSAGAGSAQGAVPTAIAAGSTASDNGTGATTILTAANLDPAPPPPAASPGLASSTPARDADVGTLSPANGPAATGLGSKPMPHAVSMGSLATLGTSTTASAPQLRAGTAPATQSSDATAKQATTASADDSTLSNGPAGSGTDAAAQTVLAAAIAQGSSEPPPDTDPDVPQGAAGSNDSAAGASAATMASAAAASMSAAVAASISAAMTAAAATSVAQAVSDAAGASAADKRSHGESPDATLSGASNDGSAGAAQLLTSNTSTDSVPTPTFKVAAGVDTAQFGQGVADRVSLMMDGNLTSAKLQVNPPALGPIEVRIALQGGHAQVWLSSHSAVTRDELEASSPKLREMLGSQGFSQVSVDISQRSFQERLPQSQAYESAPRGDAAVLAQAPLSMSRSASGLLDAYA
jgi:flagellar hook-length control protein FliK